MALVSLACLALAAYMLWRWYRPHPDEIPLNTTFPAKTLAGLLVLAGLFYIPTLRIDLAAAQAGRAVSSVVGQPLRYHCGSTLNIFFDRTTDLAVGYVAHGAEGPDKTSKLRYDVCDALVDYLSGPDDLRGDTDHKILAVHVLSHEARHMLGELNEASADCQALQRNALVALALGASEGKARELALRYYEDLYPRAAPGYRSPECRRGGHLDENLPTSPWNLVR